MSEEVNQSPAEQVAEAVAKTILVPSPVVIVEDVELALNLVKKLKSDLKHVHPSVWDLVKLMF
jgi:hypothetical protein